MTKQHLTINSFAEIACEVTRSVCEKTGLKNWISNLTKDDLLIQAFIPRCVNFKSYFRLLCVREFKDDSWSITIFPFIDENISIKFEDLSIITQLQIICLIENSFRVEEKTPEGGRVLFKGFDYDTQIDKEIQQGLVLSSLLSFLKENENLSQTETEIKQYIPHRPVPRQTH